ncbi:proline-rich transmembrane protein 1-like [Patiria miniata]|uniref:Proline-rich transmembrane protein 1-like n=1 Tax=Patiria miniata TaxID=46514 RepID=A0A913ZQF8_PATMI|nr:proline-rich transmembrane protein 1-like [Patiria miniata]
MSTEYKEFQNEADADDGANCPPTQPQPAQGDAPPQPEQGYDAPPPYNDPNHGAPGLNYPPEHAAPTMVQVVAPRPQTIISTTAVCQPNDYFGLALFVTFCCCLPLGIVGLIKSSAVRNRFMVGDIAGAEQASREAQTYSQYGLGIGIGFLSLNVVVGVVYAATI